MERSQSNGALSKLKKHRFAFSAVIGIVISVGFTILQSVWDFDADGRSNLRQFLANVDQDHDGRVTAGEYASAAAIPVTIMFFGVMAGVVGLPIITFVWLMIQGQRYIKRLAAMQYASPFASGSSEQDCMVASWVVSEYTEQRPTVARSISQVSGSDASGGSPKNPGLKKFQRAVHSARSLGIIGSGRKAGELADLWKMLHHWELDIFEVAEKTRQPLQMIGMICLQNSSYDDLPESFEIDKSKLSMFLSDMEDSYRDVPYHNSLHAASVARMVYSFCKDCGLNRRLPADMQFTLVLAGVAHDVHHPGLTAPFLSKAANPWKSSIEAPFEEADMELAMKYNDQSPLENMHCAVTFQLLSLERNAFLPPETIASIKPVLVRAILGTDMTKHAEVMTRLAMLIENLKEPQFGIPWYWPANAPPNLKPDEKETWFHNLQVGFVMELFLHAADIGTPCLPLNQWRKWNSLVQLEFHKQGDMELVEFGKFISPPVGYDRTASPKARHNFTKGFMQFLSAPLFNRIDELSKIKSDSNVAYGVDISKCLKNLNSNLKVWEEICPEDE